MTMVCSPQLGWGHTLHFVTLHCQLGTDGIGPQGDAPIGVAPAATVLQRCGPSRACLPGGVIALVGLEVLARGLRASRTGPLRRSASTRRRSELDPVQGTHEAR